MTLKQLQEVLKEQHIPEDAEVFTESGYSNETNEIVYLPSENRVYICDSSALLLEDLSYYKGGSLCIPEHWIVKVL